MAVTLEIAPGLKFTVLSSDRIRHEQNIYDGVTEIEFPDGSKKTCAQIIADAGGTTYAESELQKCVKVEGYDPASKDRGIFTVYSANSQQVAKNDNSQVPGRLTCEMFDFKGYVGLNPILSMWAAVPGAAYSTDWLGFRLVWGSTGKRIYTITYVNDFFEESQPCPPASIETTYMHDVFLAGAFRPPAPYTTPTEPTGTLYVPINRFNLYRATIGTDGGFVYRKVPIEPYGMQYGLNHPIVGDFPREVYVQYPGNYTYAFGWNYRDNVADKDLTTITLPSIDWDQPPTSEIRGLTAGWNGMIFGHWENTLIPFEPYRPHAAPARYRIALPYKINATVVDGNSLIVLTTGPVYMVTGAHPSQLQCEALQHTQSSKEADPIFGVRPPTRSVVRTPAGIAYASDEGLSIEAGGRSSNLTDKHYEKVTWQRDFRQYFGMLRLGYSNEKVISFVRETAGARSIMFSYETGQLAQLSGYSVRSTFHLPGTDGMLAILGSGASTLPSQLVRFEDPFAARKSCQWTSKKYIYAQPVVMGVGQVVGVGAVTITIYADGKVVRTVSLTLTPYVATQFRLPTGVRARAWEFTIFVSADAKVTEFYLAGTALELKGV